MRSIAMAITAAVVCGTASAGNVPIDFSSEFNFGRTNFELINGWSYPSGEQTFKGVAFRLAGESTADEMYGWHAQAAAGDNPRSVTIPIHEFGVLDVYALMNTYWGETLDGALLSVTFTGADGATATFELDGNNGIRNYNFDPGYTNHINGVTTVEVWNNPWGQQIDRQVFRMPPEITNGELVSMRIDDFGAEGLQRAFLIGVTVDIMPAPGAFLVGICGLLLFVWRRR